jgi:hypothetical protein
VTRSEQGASEVMGRRTKQTDEEILSEGYRPLESEHNADKGEVSMFADWPGPEEMQPTPRPPGIIGRGKAVKMVDGNKDRLDKMRRFLDYMAKYDRPMHASKSVDINPMTYYSWRNKYPAFAEALKIARATYRDKVLAKAQEHVFDGILQFKTTDKDGGEHFNREFAKDILAKEMNRTEPEYKDRVDIDLSSSAGVLVVPPAMTVEQFMAMVAQHKAKGGDDPSSGK